MIARATCKTHFQQLLDGFLRASRRLPYVQFVDMSSKPWALYRGLSLRFYFSTPEEHMRFQVVAIVKGIGVENGTILELSVEIKARVMKHCPDVLSMGKCCIE